MSDLVTLVSGLWMAAKHRIRVSLFLAKSFSVSNLFMKPIQGVLST